MIDTGSSSTWVNPECATAGSQYDVAFCESLPVFNWPKSTTLVNEEIPMNITYGRGNAQGGFATDVLIIGGKRQTDISTSRS